MEWGRIIDTIEEKTGKSVCKELGIRPQYLSDLRSGKSKNPNSDFVLKLIESFNLNSNWLLTGEGEMFITDIAEPAPLQIIPQEGEEIAGIPFYDIDVMAHIAESLDLNEETPAGVRSGILLIDLIHGLHCVFPCVRFEHGAQNLQRRRHCREPGRNLRPDSLGRNLPGNYRRMARCKNCTSWQDGRIHYSAVY